MNLVPILITAVAMFFLGFLWYGAIGGNLWIKLKEIPAEEVARYQEKGMGPMIPKMLGNLVIQLVLVSVLQYVLGCLGVTTYVSAVIFAVALWLGFIAAPLFNAVLWEDRKIALYIFDTLFYLTNLVAAAAMLVWLT